MSGVQLAQAAAEGLCLRLPENIASQREVSYDGAMGMLLKAAGMAQQVPFSWSYIDKPADGTVFVLFLPPSVPFPIDGIRYQEPEVKYNVGSGGPRELEVHEIKCGFVPGAGEPNASRVRRRYRLIKGGNPAFLLVHYTRGSPAHIVPAMNQPIRGYPLRAINEPAVFVAGEKQGQKFYPPGTGPMHGSGPSNIPPATIGIGLPYNQQAMLAQANNNMENLERRRLREQQLQQQQERERAHQQQQQQQASRPPPQQHRVPDEDDSGDEIDQISTRTLAFTRYKRNHDWMNEVFTQAAFGKIVGKPKSDPKSAFTKEELEERTAKLQAEVDELQTITAQRRANRIRDSQSGPNLNDQIMQDS